MKARISFLRGIDKPKQSNASVIGALYKFIAHYLIIFAWNIMTFLGAAAAAAALGITQTVFGVRKPKSLLNIHHLPKK